jgi:hypothetical protein
MRTALGCVLGAAALVLATAACSSGSGSPVHSTTPAAATKLVISAPQACKDFESWWITTANGNHLLDNPLLAKAVSEAPSGQLYQDMSTVKQNVDYVATLTSGLQQATRTMVLEQVDNVVTSDCAAINPNGG